MTSDTGKTETPLLGDPKHVDFYQELRQKIRAWATAPDGTKSPWVEYILCAPDLFHLLCKLALDERVSATEKGKLAIAIAYFISPLDLMPEIILGPIGYLDDIAISSYVLNGIISKHPEVVREHWAGEGDVLELVQRIIKKADEMLGSGLIEKIRALLADKPGDSSGGSKPTDTPAS